ncbi:MAG: hypothetical protein ACAI25_06855, partial [Planctomycetota bacterium]
MRTSAPIATLLLTLAAGPALGHGYSTHAHLSREVAKQLRSDAKYGFIDKDEGLRNCFVWGSVFPDLVNVADAVGGNGGKIDSVRAKVESYAAVKKLDISGQDVKAFGFHTHDRAFALFLVEKAEQQGDPAFLAFALGNLVHLTQDHHEEMILHPYYMVRSGSGDLATSVLRDPAALAHWGPGSEIGSIFAAMSGALRTKDEACGVRDLPRKLVASGSIFTRTTRSIARAAELKHRYYLVAKEWREVKLQNPGFMTELGFQNTVRLHEVVLTVAPYTEGKEDAGKLARVFVDRYVDLAWWADALLFVGNTFTRLVTLGQLDLFKLVAACANADRRVAPAMAGADAVGDITFAFLHGGAAEKDLRAELANNIEFQRLLASGLLDKGTYSEPFDLGVT